MTECFIVSHVRKLTFLLFFLSGASALAYEVAWVRELSLAFGVSVYAVTAVLTAFMGGLALGSWLFGRAAMHAAPLRLYAALQAGVAFLAILSPFAIGRLESFYVWLYNAITPGFYLFNIVRFGLAALVLLLPATLMGGSFPLISHFLARREDSHGRDLGLLYAVNTFGGVIGTFATGLLLIRFLGTHATLYLAAGVDLLVALAALLISYRLGEFRAGQQEASAGNMGGEQHAGDAVQAQPGLRPAGSRPRKMSRRAQRYAAGRATQSAATQPTDEELRTRARDARIVWWGFGLSGFIALGYEVVWTRLLAIFTMNTVYSFTIMLTTFLVGLAIGSALMASRADRTAQPIQTFGLLQLSIGLASVLVLFVFAKLPTLLEALTNVVSFRQEVAAEFIASSLTMLVPTLLIGATFPVAARVYARGSEVVGARMGRLYGVNTIGAMLGSLAAGFGLIPLLGLQRAALALAMLNLGLGVYVMLRGTGKPRWEAGGIIAAAALAAVLLPPGLYLGFREGTTPNLVFYEEGVDATVSVFEVKEPPLKISFVNGRSEVPTDKHSMRAFYLLGHLPPLLRPDAESALMISFGNGIASGAMARHHISRIHAVEIVAEQVEAAQLYRSENHDVLDYPGLNITIEDGRNYLLRSQEQFDIITADATHPVNSSSWALFTHEFYTLARQRLAEDGVIVQWLPFHDLSEPDYRKVIKTFQSVFPHTTLWFTGGSHTFLVGTPERLERADILALGPRIETLGIGDDLGNAQRLAEDFLMDEDEVREYVANASIVTDDNAFFLPARDMDYILESFTPYLEAAGSGE